SKWLFEYRDKVALEQNPPFLIKYIDTITKLTTFIGYLIVYYIAFTSKLSPAAFIAFSLAYSLINAMLVSVIGSIEVLANITPIFEHSKPFLNTSISNTNKIYITDITGKIEFNNVSFTYPGQTNKILDNVSLTINAGEYIAIAGKTGIGKSTLFRLILGFERPQSGAIYIDGKDINNIDLSSLRKHFGTVLQNNKLLPGDILSNIKISNPSVSESQVWNVCRIANFDKDINAMPFGLNTNVGENGGNLSGGQIQRLMIARALISNPSILLFDEAMTALDYKSQKSISEAIESLPCTRIIVSHRLSTIRHCDRIIVLDKGKIVANGIYDDLEKNSPEFQDLIKKKED
ncbi:MAG: ATP-binding cassette domain-containing protein, partial [Spirochaetales bacterium]|nr:ATP-binding cassette domain-containing protein [Spirochaetales bacterium]